MDDKIKQILKRYDELAGLILDQKVDEFADRIGQKPEGTDDETFEEYLQRMAAAETEEQTRIMENEPNELLDGKNMYEFFAQMNADELTEVLVYAAEELDRGVPDSVSEALAKSPEAAQVKQFAYKTINDAAWTDEELGDEDEIFEMQFQKAKAALAVLARMGDDSMVGPVIDRFMSYPMTRDFVADAIAEYVQAFPDTTVPIITAHLDEHEDEGLTGPCEDLVIILTRIGKEEKSEEIYGALRRAFRYMKNKIYAVICLADYGDDRAIPMMKSYINRHQTTIERDLFYEMMSAIQKLGGDIEDISDPFGDFQKKYDNGNG